ncbi:MAG: hypothetical protein WAM82_03020 [Thermoanaerobaculia bacterium]
MMAYVNISGTPSCSPSGWNPAISAMPQERTNLMQEPNGRRTISLSTLSEGMPGLTPAWGAVLAEAASICLEHQGHPVDVAMTVDGSFDASLIVNRLGVTAQMLLSNQDEEEATEHGACGIAILAVGALMSLVVARRSRRGTGFDYWLTANEENLLQQAERLEVSGIRNGSESTVKARVLEKTKQIQQFRAGSPVLIAIVEFSRPLLRLVKVSRPNLRIMKP